ncbi:hypothetical protein K443DRAFT_683439 [Laccaria amethystina LaAM-08-1]|uniref:Uncharacterized protein n=1 Tax=Laccaria amethystina LaAM-08-1 TaxID=1095629 RepID=A0A0C9X0Q1_9AGAR|nr:hypothetical protein K443DRAFT_683439 [Laccaria amethystina LaAM-08-1]
MESGYWMTSLSTYIKAPQHSICRIPVPSSFRVGEEWVGDHLSFPIEEKQTFRRRFDCPFENAWTWLVR